MVEFTFPNMPSVRVLRVITRLNVGGPSIQAMTLTDRLLERGFETQLVHGRLGTGEGDMRYLLSDTAQVVQLPALRREVAPFQDAVATAHIVRLLRAFRPHIVHSHMAKAGGVARMATLLHNRTAGRLAPARLVHTYHGHVLEGYFSPLKTRLFVGVERALAAATDRIVAISPAIRDELLQTHGIGRAEQYRVVPLGFDLAALAAIDDARRDAARAALGIPAGARVVATVGRLTAIKEQRLFLEVASDVAASDPNALFLIAGDGELRGELEAQARALGIAPRTRFLGWRRDLTTIYGATDVFLLTSRNEGTPVALIESLAAGVPGVSTDVGGVRDVIEGGLGVLVPFGDRAAAAAAVCGLLHDAPRRREIGARGRAAMIARYGLDRLVDDVERLYRELLA